MNPALDTSVKYFSLSLFVSDVSDYIQWWLAALSCMQLSTNGLFAMCYKFCFHDEWWSDDDISITWHSESASKCYPMSHSCFELKTQASTWELSKKAKSFITFLSRAQCNVDISLVPIWSLETVDTRSSRR